MIENKTILITGVAGLFGSNFSRYLLGKGYTVVGIDNFSGGYFDFLPNHSRFKFYNIDLSQISQQKLVELFDNEKIQIVYHFAAYAACGLSPFIRQFNYENNLLASIKLINTSIITKVDKFIFTSSMTVYGDGPTPFVETNILKPETSDPYAIAKFAVELDLYEANKRFGLKYNVIRPHNVHGVYQNIWDRYRNVIGIFIRKALNDEPLTIYGDGSQTRAYSDIEYYMEPLEKLIFGFDNETFNLGADQPSTILDLAQIVKKTANNIDNKEVDIVFLESRMEVHDAFCDHTKAKKLLDFHDQTNLESLINKMYRWASSQPKREVKKLDYEINQGIYSYWK